MSLTLDEAKSFLENVLFLKGWEEILKRDKMEFIRVLCAHYAHHTYFQNISMTATPPGERVVPDTEITKQVGLKGVGGACIIQNGFLVLLLKALGFNSYSVAGFVHGPGNFPDNHVICVVCPNNPEEKYILEMGVALPFAEPVAMHELPYTQTAAGVRYQYKMTAEGSNIYHRVQLDGSLFGKMFDDKTLEFVRYEFTMAPQPLEFFTKPLTGIFKVVDESYFLKQPFLFRYFEEDQDGKLVDEVNVYGNRKWILIRGVSVLIATDTDKTVTHYENYDQIKDVIAKYFPKLPKEDIDKATECFNETIPKYGIHKA